jgi:hypothetical protein
MGEKVMKQNEMEDREPEKKILRVTNCNATNPSKPSCYYRYIYHEL